jgi:ABC-type glycerol-3-phosphate transport system substrate-binding protein
MTTQLQPMSRRSFIRAGTGTVLIGASSGLLAACGGGTGAGGSSGELTIMNRWNDPPSVAAVKQMIGRFEKTQPDIDIQSQRRPSDGSTYQPAVRSAFASSNPPDMATDIAGPEVFNLVKAGQLQDLTAFYDASIKDHALAGATLGASLNGKVYGLSSSSQIGNLVFFNPDYLAKYGVDARSVSTVDQWIAAMKAVKAKGGTPITLGAKDQWPGGHYLNHLVQRTLGTEKANQLYNRTVLGGQPDTPKWTDPAVVHAFELYVSMKPLFQKGFLGEGQDGAASLFFTGKSGFYTMGSWFVSGIATNKPKFKPGVMLFPSVPGGGSPNEITLANDVILVSKKADWDATQKFLKYLYSPANLSVFGSAMLFYLPYRYKVDTAGVDPSVKDLFAQIQGFMNTAGTKGASLFNDEIIDVNIYTKYIWQGSVGLMSGDLSPQKLASQLEQATAQAQQRNA